MATKTARVATTSASRYLQQLAKHWSHKFAVEFTPERGTIALADVTLTMEAEGEALVLTLAGKDAGEVERLQEVVARHVDRFAFRETPLEYDWR